jgi:hypothetical protein
VFAAVGSQRRVWQGTVRLGDARFAVDAAYFPEPGKGQDALLIADGFVGVADGCTPVREPAADVGAFALDALLALQRSAGGSVREMFRDAISGVH